MLFFKDGHDERKPQVMVIQGPPGTGKSSAITLTICEILSKLKPGDTFPKIIVCAPSNAAVDNLALKVMKATKGKLFGGKFFNIFYFKKEELKMLPS